MKARRSPCAECPFRRDTPPGQFTAERYAALENTHGVPGREAPLDAPWFGCHKMPEEVVVGEEIACAGWLAVEGVQHLGVRFAVYSGVVPGRRSARSPAGLNSSGATPRWRRRRAGPGEQKPRYLRNTRVGVVEGFESKPTQRR